MRVAALVSLAVITVGCRHVSPTVGESCPTTLVSGDEIYLRNDMFCTEMHQIHNPGTDMDGWWAVYVIGTHATAVFEHRYDAEEWERSQPYVRTKEQVR